MPLMGLEDSLNSAIAFIMPHIFYIIKHSWSTIFYNAAFVNNGQAVTAYDT